MGVVYSLFAHAISLVVPVGDVVLYVGVELLQKLVDQGHGRTTVHVVVTVDEYALFPAHGIVESVYSHVHILHEERIDKVGQLGMEKPFGRRLGSDAPAQQQLCQDGTDV